MVDMSHYDEAENLEKTRTLAKECHDKGIAVEAESGRINGGEDGIADTGDLEGTMLAISPKQEEILTHTFQRYLPHRKTLTTSSRPRLISLPLRLETFMGTTDLQGQLPGNCTSTAWML